MGSTTKSIDNQIIGHFFFQSKCEAERAGNSLLAVSGYTQGSGFAAEAIAVAFTTNQTDSRFQLPEGFEYNPELYLMALQAGANDNHSPELGRVA